MKPPEPQICLTLKPYDVAEAINLKEAAGLAGMSVRTVTNWCSQHGIGRRINGGAWKVSRVALAMLLDDDMIALAAYQAGDRASPLVGPYFARFGLKSHPQRLQSSQGSQG